MTVKIENILFLIVQDCQDYIVDSCASTSEEAYTSEDKEQNILDHFPFGELTLWVEDNEVQYCREDKSDACACQGPDQRDHQVQVGNHCC